MRLDQYQAKAVSTMSGVGNYHTRLAVLALGIAGEAGEVADMVKKIIGHGHPADREKLIKELGDVLWYVATMAHLLGAPLEHVAHVNIEKLEARYPDGFTTERSMNRSGE